MQAATDSLVTDATSLASLLVGAIAGITPAQVALALKDSLNYPSLTALQMGQTLKANGVFPQITADQTRSALQAAGYAQADIDSATTQLFPPLPPGTWRLASRDSTVSLDLDVSGNGPLKGTLIFKGKRYPVTGEWAASGSVPGRNASAFSLAGRTEGLPDVPNFLAASGIMSGPGARPTQIDLRVGVSSSSDGTLTHYSGVLFPT